MPLLQRIAGRSEKSMWREGLAEVDVEVEVPREYIISHVDLADSTVDTNLSASVINSKKYVWVN